MTITNRKILESDYTGRDITGLSNQPNDNGMTAAELKAQFDKLIKEVVSVKFNLLIDDLASVIANSSGARQIGLEATPSLFYQTVYDALIGLATSKVDKETGKSLIPDASLTDLTDGGDTTLHIHDTRYYTEAEVDAKLLLKQNNADASGKLLVSYTHTGNLEVITTSLDLATGVFTKINHGLVNGNAVCPILNFANAMDIPKKYFPVGLEVQRYYIVNVTADTFQVSTTSGGVAVTFTTNATMDLSKWHFEKYSSQVDIIGLGLRKKCRIRVSGQCPRIDFVIPYITSNGQFQVANFLSSATNSINQLPSMIVSGSVFASIDFLIDFSSYLTLSGFGIMHTASSASQNAATIFNKIFTSSMYENTEFEKVFVGTGYILNGTKVEVYSE